MMKKNFLNYLLFFAAFTTTVFSQTKVSGVVLDKQRKPIPFANIAFKNSSEGVVSSEDGVFYLESSKTYKTIIIIWCKVTQKKSMTNVKLLGNLPEIVWIVQHGH